MDLLSGDWTPLSAKTKEEGRNIQSSVIGVEFFSLYHIFDNHQNIGIPLPDNEREHASLHSCIEHDCLQACSLSLS
ncbi:hypothetical protein LOK49_LG05G01646 [Camellia lanceoleosa]|uniref:Uncharacterized protein n=1 Tax=Camellia lanceoleosa TaxID=1840588 RepID=A0ACC0HRY6_9ERIC|nr:hypothetical protein LOK49_LG05G01646 [Camellia lanceoleosa]